jgi:AcrR family transcriptional regulator
MAKGTEAVRRQGPRLSRERIVAAAVELADLGGLESLTMRGIGHTLGVEAMSLYNHVEDKDDILSGIVERVFSEIDVTEGPSWRDAMRRTAISAHDAMMRHPWACELILRPNTRMIFPARLVYMESILARLRRAGLTPEGASRGYHAIDSHVFGFTMWELGHALPDDMPPGALEAILEEMDFSSYPYLLEHVDVHLKGTGAQEVGEFEFGLELILDGLARWVGAT